MNFTALDQFQKNVSPGPFYEDDTNGLTAPATSPVRLIAYYLPQFHAFPENDEWWGKGFTEWTNVTKAVPRYEGHLQPRLPGELGFYDLNSVEVLRRQAALAKRFGISGFCIHHYWFDGHPLMGKPLQMLLDNPDIDLPFFLNWANESWSRRWDGSDELLLIEQRYSPENDIAFAKSIEPAMRDPRYIRIDGRPLMMVYRPRLFPDAKATMARWREYFISVGVGDPYFIMPQLLDHDPRPFGMDAAAGFPPHRTGFQVPSRTKWAKLFDPMFGGLIKSYDQMAANAINLPKDEFHLMPGVCPDWDNEARRPSKGVSFEGSTPSKYGDWLTAACNQVSSAENPEERIVFINAWNEWAEGAYLEPDRHHGYAYLAETARVLHDLNDDAALSKRRARVREAAAYAGPPSDQQLKGLFRRLSNKAARTIASISRPTP